MRSRALPALFACLLLGAAPALDPPAAPAQPAPGPTTAVGAEPCGGPPIAPGVRWECTFSDEFDGSSLDRGRWLPVQTAVNGMTGGEQSCYVDDARNITVRDGLLRLSAIHLAEPLTCHRPSGDFSTRRTAASLTTRGRFSQTYGRFEFRAKMPRVDASGAHSALWLYPDRQTYGAWPRSGEIDVAEWYSALPDRIYPSLHYVDGADDVVTGQRGTVRSASRFHTYAVEWTPDVMRFSYDGALVFEHAWQPSSELHGSQPFDQPFNVVLTQVWGADWNAPTAATPRRLTMKVDWVRVWRGQPEQTPRLRDAP